jgi:hypothetical protein
LQQIVSRNAEWAMEWDRRDFELSAMLEAAKRNPGARANFCNANLRRCKLNEAVLDGAQFNGANLTDAKLDNASLRSALLNAAVLVKASLRGADLLGAELNDANLGSADLTEADLTGAKLNDAWLLFSQLDRAVLAGTELKNASLMGISITDAHLFAPDLTGALYSPESGPPSGSFIGGIKGLAMVKFPPGQEVGLVRLRDVLQKAGLREQEREATFAIEHGRTRHAINESSENPGAAIEAIFRTGAFEWTTGYGLYPSGALIVIVAVWFLLIPVYFWPIRLKPYRPTAAGIYQVWPSDRIEVDENGVSLGKSATVSRLQSGTLAAIGRAAYFSLLSAFHIGWRELNVGTWIARIQPREYALRATGWVRVVSGIQSLLSVYLLAIWALTYFGRPFQ